MYLSENTLVKEDKQPVPLSCGLCKKNRLNVCILRVVLAPRSTIVLNSNEICRCFYNVVLVSNAVTKSKQIGSRFFGGRFIPSYELVHSRVKFERVPLVEFNCLFKSMFQKYFIIDVVLISILM